MSPLTPEQEVLLMQVPEVGPTPAKRPHYEAQVSTGSIFGDYAEDSILHTVQMARIFADSKTFVDMKLRHSPSTVEAAFRAVMEANLDRKPSQDAIRQFVNDNFTMENQMEDHVPDDWVACPKLVGKIVDLNYSMFAQDLNSRWKILCRKIKRDVHENPDRYTLLYLPHPVIVPGGRFREIYYWDSYWIIRGLLQCEMYSTAKGLLLNFVHLIKQFGLIPNGGRSYYINRSQPPMFIQMVREYVKATGDVDFVRNNISYMEDELYYWRSNHMVTVCHPKTGACYQMARFNCEDNGPRPESYAEDYDLAHEHTTNETDKTALYWELKTGAETGWDYSTRWYSNNGTHSGGLQDTKARSLIPVDLNCYLARNATIMADFFTDIIQDQAKATEYSRLADDLTIAVEEVLWHEQDGIWYDYDMSNAIPRRYFNPANLVPLWTETFTKENRPVMVKQAVAYMQNQNLAVFPGGVPTTFTTSGQQWDFPNCWPPLEHMVVQGLEKTGLPEARDLAFSLAEKRVRGSYLNFCNKGHMFEKYDATSATRIGGGGEYEIQLGFGWTNGVVLDFLDMYGDRLTCKNILPQQVHAEPILVADA